MGDFLLKEVREAAVDDAQRCIDAIDRDLAVEALDSVRRRLAVLLAIFAAAQMPELAEDVREFEFAVNEPRASAFALRAMFKPLSDRLYKALELSLYG